MLYDLIILLQFNCSNYTIKEKGNYKDGLPDGLWEEYYSNAKLKSKANYTKGNKTSEWQYFYSNGDKNEIVAYDNGKSISWYRNGQKEFEGWMKNGQKDTMIQTPIKKPLVQRLKFS